MENHDALVLRIIKAVPADKESKQPMDIIIHRPYAYLLREFRKAYANEEIKIKVDSRYSERRKEKRLVLNDHRYSDRRQQVERNWQMNLIVQKQYAQLTDGLEQVFGGQEDVKIIVDGRSRERRKKSGQMVTDDRRAADRRKKGVTLVEAVFSC